MGKKRILIITPRLPYPLFSGGEHAQYHFINRMRQEMDISLCFEINSLDYNSKIDDLEKLKEEWREVNFFPLIKIVEYGTIKKTIKWTKRVFNEAKRVLYNILMNEKETPSEFVKYNSLINQPFLLYKSDFTNHVASIARGNTFDIIQIDFISLASLVYILPSDPVKVLVHHEIRYVRIKRESDLFEIKDSYDHCRLEAIKDQEISLLNKFDKIITLTKEDKEILSKDIPVEKLYISPATIKYEYSHNTNFIPFKDRLVFIGSSIHLPNKDGIRWFIENVMPSLRKEIPTIHLDIVGRWEKSFIKDFKAKDIRFLGFIDDLNLVLSDALLIVPIRIGSGMRLKIIEAVNHNVPFITTSIGVEGLSFEHDKECIIANTAEEFLNEIKALSNNREKQEGLVKKANSKLQAEYSYEMAMKKRLDFYKLIS